MGANEAKAYGMVDHVLDKPMRSGELVKCFWKRKGRDDCRGLFAFALMEVVNKDDYQEWK